MCEKRLDYTTYNNILSSFYEVSPQINSIYNFNIKLKEKLCSLITSNDTQQKTSNYFSNLAYSAETEIIELNQLSEKIFAGIELMFIRYESLQNDIENPLDYHLDAILFERNFSELNMVINYLNNLMFTCKIKEIIIFNDIHVSSNSYKTLYIVDNNPQILSLFSTIDNNFTVTDATKQIYKTNTKSSNLIKSAPQKTIKRFGGSIEIFDKIVIPERKRDYLKLLKATILSMIIFCLSGMLICLFSALFNVGLPRILSIYIGLCFLGLLITAIYAAFSYYKRIKRK